MKPRLTDLLLPVQLLTSMAILALPATGAEPPQRAVLTGEVGNAASACAARFRFAPFDSLPWLRADLTNEQVSEFDDRYGHIMRRPFKQYSGDISGRFVEIMALNSRGDLAVHPALKQLLDEVVKQQRPGGYYCASGPIDWQQPIDYINETSPGSGGRMLPALWGNSRMLCGLVEASRAFPEHAGVAKAARQLGDFYIAMLPRFNNPARTDEYKSAGSYAAGHITCWFPAMEGLVKLGALTGERKYINAAKEMAAFYEPFDRLPIDHAHGMLCCQVSLLLLFETTRDPSYLARVEKRWDELVTGGFINPAGGILEKCHVRYTMDEGCGIADWIRLNLALGRSTGNPRYWAMAERALHNHLLQNQNLKGGFGHRTMQTDPHGVCGFSTGYKESTWCCSFHGEVAFIRLREHLLTRGEGILTCHFALDFTATDAVGTTTSLLHRGIKPGEILRQRISLAGQPATKVRARIPHWADEVTLLSPAGKSVPHVAQDGWLSTHEPVTEVEFVFTGGVYAEDRCCTRLPDGPRPGKAFVLGYGPKLLAMAGGDSQTPAWPIKPEEIEARGLKPLSAGFFGKNCRFVFGSDE
ncbi:MAG: glycoside hydrolase family 127 protein [Akkermansiaceae bacterium]|nr:glycoside hydrolase family 127 protein [Akkermansiaceae bacterium]